MLYLYHVVFKEKQPKYTEVPSVWFIKTDKLLKNLSILLKNILEKRIIFIALNHVVQIHVLPSFKSGGKKGNKSNIVRHFIRLLSVIYPNDNLLFTKNLCNDFTDLKKEL